MSERERWLPTDDEIHLHLIHKGGIRFISDYCRIVRDLLRATVEKALAEQELVNSKATEDLIRRCREELSEQEAHHRREVIEARIDTLTAHGDCVCPLYSVYGERLSAVDPECVVCSELKRLEGELAALEEKP